VTWTWPLSDKELIALCPIDGPLGRRLTPAERRPAEITAEVERVVRALRSVGQDNWAGMLEATLRRWSDRDIYVGHAVAILLSRGLVALELLPGERQRLEQFLVDVVAMWEPRSA
jgi:hypothetical protein